MSRGGSARQRRRQRRQADRAALGVGKAQGTTATETFGSETALDTALIELSALAGELGIEIEPFTVVGGNFALGDRDEAWDGGAAEKSYDVPRDANHFMYRDADGDPANKASYKLPFVSDGHAVWKAITAIAGVLSGSRGGADIPAGDKDAIKSKVEGYYAKAREKYNDPDIKAPWAEESSSETVVLALAYAEAGDEPEALNEAVDRIAPEFGLVVEALLDDDGERVGGMFTAESGFAYATVAARSEPYTGKCSMADCGHMAAAHSGSMNDGACSMQSCECMGFKPGGANAGVSDEFGAVPQDDDNDSPKGGKGDGDGDQDDEPMSGTCDCGHSSTSHAGDMSDGACMAEGCDCTAFHKANSLDASAGQWFTVTANSSSFDPHFLNGWQNVEPSASARTSIRLTDFTLTFPDGSSGSFAPGTIELPAEHMPKSEVPEPTNEIRPPEAPPVTGAVSWTAVLAPEGQATDDGRIFAPGSITWRDLPLTLMGMIETQEGHDGAQVCGRIDRIWRDEASGLIYGAGVFDTGEFGSQIARLVNDGTLRGVSVDIAVSDMEIVPRSQVVDESGAWAEQPKEEGAEEEEGPSLLDILFGGDDDVLFVVRKGVIGAATVCPFPAFAQANIKVASSLTASVQAPNVWTATGQGGFVLTAHAVQESTGATETAEEGEAEVLTASAAGMAPTAPPAEWFHDPKLEQLTALTVDDEGRIFGHAAAWDTCHIGIPGACTTAPHSNTDYAYYMLKEIVCDDGSRVAVGTITLNTGHASQSASRVEAARHYDDTGTAVADVIVGEDAFGIYVAGALRGDVSADEARKLRGAALSGDWRSVNGNLELVGLLAVNVPGFPVPRTNASLVASGDAFEVSALVAAGIHDGNTVAALKATYQEEVAAHEEAGEYDELRALTDEAA